MAEIDKALEAARLEGWKRGRVAGILEAYRLVKDAAPRARFLSGVLDEVAKNILKLVGQEPTL